MDEAGREAERVLVILSRSYFESKYTLAELTQALYRDAAGRKGTVIPVMVEKSISRDRSSARAATST